MKIYPMHLDVEHPNPHDLPRITLKFLSDGRFDYKKFIGSNWEMDFAPEKVIKKCVACGQWGASQCECRYCGHPVD